LTGRARKQSNTFTIAVAVLTLTFILAGRLEDRFGPFYASVTGGSWFPVNVALAKPGSSWVLELDLATFLSPAHPIRQQAVSLEKATFAGKHVTDAAPAS
jgi:hypothetical protein